MEDVSHSNNMIPSKSLETHRKQIQPVEIHVHSKDFFRFSSPSTSSSSSSSSSFCETGQVGEVMVDGLSRLLHGHAVEGLEYVGSAGKGRLKWKEVEEKYNESGLVEKTNTFGEAIAQRKNRVDRHIQMANNMNSLITDPSIDSATEVSQDQKNQNGCIIEKEIEQAIFMNPSIRELSISREDVRDYTKVVIREFNQADGEILLPASNVDDWMQSSACVKFRSQWRRVWVVLLWLSACFGLFAWKFLQYRRRSAFEIMGYCLCTAKGAAETLKLNMALVLLPVCRNTVTWLRKNRRFSSIVPFNDNINFHKLIAGGIVTGVILHGGTHLTCDFPRIVGAKRSLFRRTIGADFQLHQPSYMEILATTEGATGIAMVVLMTLAFMLATRLPRRRPSSLPWPVRKFVGFNAFWYSHHLFIVVYVLLVVHSMFLFLTQNVTEKTTWMYLAIPVLLYSAERLIRIIRAGKYDVKILKANLYPGKVLSLKLHKPAGFQYQSGMYMFVQCPQISEFEWHPFSLTSAPDDDYLSIHIRTLGDWSHQIYCIFQEALAMNKLDFPKIHIDGPYGAASQDHVKYDVILLIGLGIGATPFISILKDIAHGLNKFLPVTVEEACSRGPKKVYFYWITREQSSFEWFKDIMQEVSIANEKAVIEMHNYLTSVSKEHAKRLVMMSAIQALHLSKSGINNTVSKMPVQMHFARPDWARVFSDLAESHRGEKIGIFYCGPETLARSLETLCYKMTTNTATRFVFHKEHY